MYTGKPLQALGMMSGTSMDGIDAALLRTDGAGLVEPVASRSFAYDSAFRDALRGCLGRSDVSADISQALTRRHAEAASALLDETGVAAANVDIVGFHGHTVLHDPDNDRTVQIGDGEQLARLLGVDVVSDFRSADVAAGGQGAPFAPIFHAALAPAERPMCFLNIGGVANLTWIGPGADPSRPDVFDHLVAFDTGPGNAMIDDWVAARTGQTCDLDGKLAMRGAPDRAIVETLMAHPYFEQPPPKSLDRNDFDASAVQGLSLEDGAATLAMFTVKSIERAADHLPEAPARWLVTGGGRKNPYIVSALRDALGAPVEPTETAGIDGDALEAQAFGYLAVRCLQGWPLSGPSTTGVRAPQTGGRLSPVRAA